MFFLRYFNNTAEYQQAESSMEGKRPSLGYTDDNEQFHWFPYVRTLSITAMSLTNFGTVTGSSGHWSQKMGTEETEYTGELVIEGSNLDLISALTIGHTGCTVTKSVKSRKKNRKVYNVEITVTDTAQTNNCYVTFSYGGYDLSGEYDFVVPSKYLTFTATEAGTFKLSGNSVNYSLDNGTTWATLASNTNSPTVPAGSSIMWKATLTPTSGSGIGRFSSTARFVAKGNPMSLLYGDNFNDQTNLAGKNYAFYRLFSGCTRLTSAESLLLPATTLAPSCYYGMFQGCTSLTTAPELPATTLSGSCYFGMFGSCTSLATAPELPATTLKTSCYRSTFSGCTSLTTAPELPATTLATRCYQSIFQGCTSLTTAPELSGTTLTTYCYYAMFGGCASLTTAPSLPATTLTSYCYHGMFSGCTSLTTAPELSATTLADYCYHGMFQGCTSLTTAPSLPATTLVTSCYSYMFNSCTSLTTAPVLSSTTLVEQCYSFMFCNCQSLTTAPSLPATTLASSCYYGMFEGCIRLTRAPELPATTLADSCYNSMFSGCTRLTTAPEIPKNMNGEMSYDNPPTAIENYPNLPSNCLSNMFSICSSLNKIVVNCDTILTSSYSSNWVKGVAATGDFYTYFKWTAGTAGDSTRPSTWTYHWYSNDPV